MTGRILRIKYSLIDLAKAITLSSVIAFCLTVSRSTLVELFVVFAITMILYSRKVDKTDFLAVIFYWFLFTMIFLIAITFKFDIYWSIQYQIKIATIVGCLISAAMASLRSEFFIRPSNVEKNFAVYLGEGMWFFGMIFILSVMLFPVWLGIGSVVGVFGSPDWYIGLNWLYSLTMAISSLFFCLCFCCRFILIHYLENRPSI